MINAGRIKYSIEILKDLLLLKREWNVLGVKFEDDNFFIAVSGKELPEVKENELIPEVIITIDSVKKEIIDIKKL